MWSATNTSSASGFGFELFFVRAAAKKSLHAAHEEHLKRSHQRRCAGAIENFGQIVFRQVELEQAEVAHIRRHQVFDNSVAEALAEEGFVAYKHIGRAQLARLNFADKPLGLGKRPHQKYSEPRRWLLVPSLRSGQAKNGRWPTVHN